MRITLNGEVPNSCLTSVLLYGLETVALAEQQWQMLHVCHNSRVSTITAAEVVNRRRTEDQREETGVCIFQISIGCFHNNLLLQKLSLTWANVLSLYSCTYGLE